MQYLPQLGVSAARWPFQPNWNNIQIKLDRFPSKSTKKTCIEYTGYYGSLPWLKSPSVITKDSWIQIRRAQANGAPWGLCPAKRRSECQDGRAIRNPVGMRLVPHCLADFVNAWNVAIYICSVTFLTYETFSNWGQRQCQSQSREPFHQSGRCKIWWSCRLFWQQARCCQCAMTHSSPPLDLEVSLETTWVHCCLHCRCQPLKFFSPQGKMVRKQKNRRGSSRGCWKFEGQWALWNKIGSKIVTWNLIWYSWVKGSLSHYC